MPIAPDSPELARLAKRRGRMLEVAAVEEVPVWRPCATDLGFRAEVLETRVAVVQTEGRRPVLPSACGTVSTFLAGPTTVEVRPPRSDPPIPEHLRALFKVRFARGDGYKAAGAE